MSSLEDVHMLDATEGKDVAQVLFGASDAENLKASIVKAHGRCWILVHRAMAQERKPDFVARARKAFERGITEYIPTICLEEADQFFATKEWIETLFQGERREYVPRIIPTDWQDPHPHFEFPPGSGRTASWDNIRNLLYYLGVKQVYVGGMYLSSPRPHGTDPRLEQGCVNDVWFQLSNCPWNVVPALATPMSGREARNLMKNADLPKNDHN